MEERYTRLFKTIRDRVITEWGRGWDNLGVRLQRALLAEALVDLLIAQDEDVSAERVREILDAGHAWLCEWYEKNRENNP
jgi:hypothetical protein